MYYRQPTSTPTATMNPRNVATTENWACYEYRDIWHIKRDCLKLKNVGENARGRASMIGTRDAIQDPTVVTSTFPINVLYATILFNSGAEKSLITLDF